MMRWSVYYSGCISEMVLSCSTHGTTNLLYYALAALVSKNCISILFIGNGSGCVALSCVVCVVYM